MGLQNQLSHYAVLAYPLGDNQTAQWRLGMTVQEILTKHKVAPEQCGQLGGDYIPMTRGETGTRARATKPYGLAVLLRTRAFIFLSKVSQITEPLLLFASASL